MLLGTGYSSSLRLPFVSVFVPLVVSNLFPYFSIYCYSFLWVRLGRKVLLVFHLFPCLSPLLAPTPCLSSLSLGAWWQRILLVCHLFPCLAACLLVCSTTPPRAQCSLFWLLWGNDSRCVPSVSAPVSLLVPNLFWHFSLHCCCSLWVLPAHRMLIGCSLSIVCFRTCRPCCLHFVPFFLFLSFFLCFFLSLSLALLLSRCLLGPLILLVCHLFPYVSSLFSPSCILVSLVLSKLYPSFAPHCYSSLRLLWAECFSLLVFLRISLLACLCVLWDETYYPLHSLTLSLLHVSLQAVSLSSLHYRASF